MKKLFLATAMLATACHQPEGLSGLGFTGRKTVIHKKDAEGVLEIDALTGQVLPGQHDRPEWSDGLVLAQLTERHLFYASRLGDAYSEEMKMPELLAFEDLGWLCVDPTITEEEGGEDGATSYREADDEFRMNVIANILAISRDVTHDHDADSPKGAVEAEIAFDRTRTEQEQKAFIEAQDHGFGKADEQGQKQATGSNG